MKKKQLLSIKKSISKKSNLSLKSTHKLLNTSQIKNLQKKYNIATKEVFNFFNFVCKLKTNELQYIINNRKEIYETIVPKINKDLKNDSIFFGKLGCILFKGSKLDELPKLQQKLCKKMNTIFKSSQKSIKLNGGSGKGFSSSSSRKTTGNNNTQVYMDAVSMIFILLYFSYDYFYNKHKPPKKIKPAWKQVDNIAEKAIALSKRHQNRLNHLKELWKEEDSDAKTAAIRKHSIMSLHGPDKTDNLTN